ncbi:IS3 family transposase [Micromonospora musae]|uniref:IS3 family transposase n=1 Tax=Micromonospora musae TaxID=1894970 RepID=UPI003445F7C3
MRYLVPRRPRRPTDPPLRPRVELHVVPLRATPGRQRDPALDGSVGDSFDNALMENLWSTLKIELVYRNSWRTRDEAENAIFSYIDGWYNTRRIQKDLGWRSPDEHEAAWHAYQARQDETAIVQPEPTRAR